MDQRIQNNILKMIEGGASESEIDTYLSMEGLDPNAIKTQPGTLPATASPGTQAPAPQPAPPPMAEAPAPVQEQPQQAQQARERSGLEQAGRMAGLPLAGFANRAMDIVGAIPDTVAAGMRGVGLPAPESPTYYRDALKAGYGAAGDALTAPMQGSVDLGPAMPETTAERALYGAGQGAADVTSVMLPAAAVGRVAQAGGTTQGVARALTAQPVMQGVAGATGGAVTEATDNPLLGAGAALAVPLAASAAGRVIAPVRSQLTGEEARLAKVARANNIPLTPADASGSRPLRTMESVFEGLPLTAGPQARVRQDQASAFTKAVLSRAGINADNAAPDVLAANRDRLSRIFKRLSTGSTIRITPDVQQSFQQVLADYGRNLPTAQREVIKNYVDDLMAVGPDLAGETYQKTRTALWRLSKSGTDTELQNAARALRNALDDAASASIPAKNQAEWQEARLQYAMQKIIERAMTNSTADATAGNIPPTALSNAVRMSDRDGFARGRGELNDLARVGTAFVRDNIPNSGTAERTMMQSLMTGGGIGGGAAIVGADPITALGVGASSMLGPRAVQALYNSGVGARYLSPSSMRVLQAGPLASLLTGATAGQAADTGLLPPELNRGLLD